MKRNKQDRLQRRESALLEYRRLARIIARDNHKVYGYLLRVINGFNQNEIVEETESLLEIIKLREK